MLAPPVAFPYREGVITLRPRTTYSPSLERRGQGWLIKEGLPYDFRLVSQNGKTTTLKQGTGSNFIGEFWHL